MDNEIRAHRGLIPWSVGEYNWVMQTFMKRRKNLKGNMPLPLEFAHLKDEIADMDPGELYNFNSMLMVSDIFHSRYASDLLYNAHFFRFHEIKDFMHEYCEELSELGFIPSPDDIMNVNPKLLESLCVLPFSLEGTYEDGETYFTFSFDEVVAATEAKLGGPLKSVVSKKEPKNKSDDEDKAFRGMIPWSKAEFNWIMEQQTKRGMNHQKKQDLKDEYLPLKIQMMRQTGKNIDNFDTMALLNEIFHERYHNRIEAIAHFARYHFIFQFLHEYKNELIKEGFVDEAKGDIGFVPELIDSLCVLPYSLKETESTKDKKHAFLYSEVVTRTRTKISARLN